MLFGHQNDANQPAPDQSGVNPLAVDPASGVSLPAAPQDQWQQQPQDRQTFQPQTTFSSGPTPQPSNDNSYGSGTNYGPSQQNQPQPHQYNAPDQVAHGSNDGGTLTDVSDESLLNLKQQALEQLSPLVSHLEQSPEEKFRTTMMMIQSSDNQSLIKDAYEAAQAIADDKVRAQALLDIVNEINYFTQHEN